MHEMYDGEFLSFATILLGFLFLVFLIAGGIFVYLYATKMDRETATKASKSNQSQI